MLMRWQEGFSIGVIEIDIQHKLLFEKFNTFLTAYLGGKTDANELYHLFWFVEAYILTHFKDEEKLMQEVAFPDYPKHCKRHVEFVATVGKLKERIATEGLTDQVIKTIADTVKNWLIHHICNEDLAIGLFIKNNSGRA